MKKIVFCLLFTSLATTSPAADDKVILANVEKHGSFEQKSVAFAPLVTEKYEYYEVGGCCEKDLQCQMKQKGVTWSDGKKYDSTTSWHVSWKYGYNRAPQACSADSFQVAVEIVFRYPKWVQSGDAPRALVDKWDSYMKNLVVHENGHRDMALEAAAELSRAVAEMPPAPTCTELDREVQALSRTRMSMLNDDEKEYDISTNHGYTQGAVFR